MFDCKVIVITIYFSTGYFRFESFYNEAANRIKKSADVIVNRMLIELESGGNDQTSHFHQILLTIHLKENLLQT
jgi:hypothetical protein